MPKIEVNEMLFHELVGRKWTDYNEFEEALTCAKAELAEAADHKLPQEERIIKIELNDTNRPDLWSTAGCARQLRIHNGGEKPKYSFFSSSSEKKEASEYRIIVDPKLEKIRPFIAAFVIVGKPINDIVLRDIIQTQEKLCWNFGRKRRSIAMGVYRTALMKWPVHYIAADPDKTQFIPLGEARSMSLRQICSEHPKGQEYGYIVADYQYFPYLTDNQGDTLSFPPVINSARIGAVEVGDSELFIELTGTEMPSLALAANMIACDFADLGYSIKPVCVEYPYDTLFGRNVVFPYYFQEPIFCTLSRIERFLGERLSAKECVDALEKMGCRAETVVSIEAKGERSESGVLLYPPEYRNDFLHAADVAEDVMIGRTMRSFKPVHPHDFTVGRLLPITSFCRKVKEIFIGLGYQEMIYNYLGSRRDFIERMRGNGENIVQIDNPMSDNFEFVRNSILPSLLMSESVSANALYPHRIFEVGKTLVRDENMNYGVRTKQGLAFLQASPDTNFNSVASQLQALFYYLERTYTVEEFEDKRFIPGRSASILYEGNIIGCFGEIHPEVLENWGITMPCTVAEIDLDPLL